MSRIDNILKSKAAMPVAGFVALVGAAAVALGVIALVGRFGFATKMGDFLGKAGRIALPAAGGAALAVALAAIGRRVMSKEKKDGTQGQQSAGSTQPQVLSLGDLPTSNLPLARLYAEIFNLASDDTVGGKAQRIAQQDDPETQLANGAEHYLRLAAPVAADTQPREPSPVGSEVNHDSDA